MKFPRLSRVGASVTIIGFFPTRFESCLNTWPTNWGLIYTSTELSSYPTTLLTYPSRTYCWTNKDKWGHLRTLLETGVFSSFICSRFQDWKLDWKTESSLWSRIGKKVGNKISRHQDSRISGKNESKKTIFPNGCKARWMARKREHKKESCQSGKEKWKQYNNQSLTSESIMENGWR